MTAGLIAGSTMAVYQSEVPFIELTLTPESDKEKIEALIHLYAEKYDVPYTRIYNTIACETANTFDPNIQSKIRYTFSSAKRGIEIGEREQSYGLAQIHLPDHPEVTMAQAVNPDFAIEFMASRMRNMTPSKSIWYCER